MTLTDNDLDILEAYFNDTLTDTERLNLEQRLQTDKDFREEMIKYRKVSEALKVVKRRDDVAFLKEVDATMPPVRQFHIWWLVLAIVGLMAIGWMVWRTVFDAKEPVQNHQKSNSPIAALFRPYPSDETTKGVETQDNRTTAFKAYEAQNYALATTLFGKAYTDNQEPILLFYQGIAQLGSGASSDAQIIFEKLKDVNEIPSKALSFYLGLAFAENGQTDKARTELKKVANTEGGYQEAAIQALGILEKKK